MVVNNLQDLTEDHEKYRTDKKMANHGYVSFYDKLFKPFQHLSGNLLEIGIYNGGSIKLWHDYFTKMNIYGIDIDQRAIDGISNLGPRVKGFNIHQEDRVKIKDFSNNYGPFSIIIDDGSHQQDHIITTFETLWPFIIPGGLYIVEDVFFANNPKYSNNGKFNCVTYFFNIINNFNNLNGRKYYRGRGGGPGDPTIMDNTVESILFVFGRIIISKYNKGN